MDVDESTAAHLDDYRSHIGSASVAVPTLDLGLGRGAAHLDPSVIGPKKSLVGP